MRLAKTIFFFALAALTSCERNPAPEMPAQDPVVELVSALEAEVNNGGFDQFFLNSAGDDTQETITALERIGALKTAKIVREAAARFPAGSPPQDRTSREEELLKIAPDSQAFEDHDRAFYKYEDDLDALVKAYAARGKP